MKTLGRLEVRTHIEWINAALTAETLFAFVQGRAQERVAVSGQDYLPGLEVEGDGANMLERNGKTVNHAIGNVLLLHGLYHVRNDDRTSGIV